MCEIGGDGGRGVGSGIVDYELYACLRTGVIHMRPWERNTKDNSLRKEDILRF